MDEAADYEWTKRAYQAVGAWGQVTVFTGGRV
jgi:hypothetical protein